MESWWILMCKYKELDHWGSCKSDNMGDFSTCDCKCNKGCKIDKYLGIKNYSSEKLLMLN